MMNMKMMRMRIFLIFVVVLGMMLLVPQRRCKRLSRCRCSRTTHAADGETDVQPPERRNQSSCCLCFAAAAAAAAAIVLRSHHLGELEEKQKTARQVGQKGCLYREKEAKQCVTVLSLSSLDKGLSCLHMMMKNTGYIYIFWLVCNGRPNNCKFLRDVPFSKSFRVDTHPRLNLFRPHTLSARRPV